MEKSFFANRDDRCGLTRNWKVARQRAERTFETSKTEKTQIALNCRGQMEKKFGADRGDRCGLTVAAKLGVLPDSSGRRRAVGRRSRVCRVAAGIAGNGLR